MARALVYAMGTSLLKVILVPLAGSNLSPATAGAVPNGQGCGITETMKTYSCKGITDALRKTGWNQTKRLTSWDFNGRISPSFWRRGACPGATPYHRLAAFKRDVLGIPTLSPETCPEAAAAEELDGFNGARSEP